MWPSQQCLFCVSPLHIWHARSQMCDFHPLRWGHSTEDPAGSAVLGKACFFDRACRRWLVVVLQSLIYYCVQPETRAVQLVHTHAHVHMHTHRHAPSIWRGTQRRKHSQGITTDFSFLPDQLV